MSQSRDILQRARMRHTWLAALSVVPLLAIAGPAAHGIVFHEIIELVGFGLIIMGVVGRMVCAMFIGGRKGAELTTEGPYSVVRNPLYVFSFLAVVGIGLTSGMVLVATAMALVFATYYADVVRREEAFLLAAFGESYGEYMARVPRWLPDPRLWRMPDRIETSPRHIFLTLRDVAWMPLLYPVMESLEWLHAEGIVPTLFLIY